MPVPDTSRSNKQQLRSSGKAKAMPGAVTSPKAKGNGPMDGAVAYQPKSKGNTRIPGAVTGPKGS